MEYESSAQMAERLNINKRTVQLWAKNKKIPGAYKQGRDWLIPKGNVVTKDMREKKISTKPLEKLLPLINTAYTPGNCLKTIQGIEDMDLKQIALAEYYYFSGQPERVCKKVEDYLSNENMELRLSAYILYVFANLSLGRIYLVRTGLEIMKDNIESINADGIDPEIKAVYVFLKSLVSVPLHISESKENLADHIKYLPKGFQLFSCYLQAHIAYLNNEYGIALGIAQTSLSLCDKTYPIAMVYIHLIAAISLMNMKQVEKAKQHFFEAWDMARLDHLIEGFGEHHGLLHGLIESCMKKKSPDEYAEIIDITYNFSAGWRKVHNRDTNEEVADNLTTMEFTIAMLASRGWRNSEISTHMKLSENTIKYYMSIVYQKLGISNRKQLHRYMLK